MESKKTNLVARTFQYVPRPVKPRSNGSHIFEQREANSTLIKCDDPAIMAFNRKRHAELSTTHKFACTVSA